MLIDSLRASPLAIHSTTPTPTTPTVTHSTDPAPSLALPRPTTLTDPSITTSHSTTGGPIASSISLTSVSFTGNGSVDGTRDVNALITSSTTTNAIRNQDLANHMQRNSTVSCVHFGTRRRFSLSTVLDGLRTGTSLQLVQSIGGGNQISTNSTVLNDFGDNARSRIISIGNLNTNACFLRMGGIGNSSADCDLGVSTETKVPNRVPNNLSKSAPDRTVPVANRLGNVHDFLNGIGSDGSPISVCQFAVGRTIAFTSVLDKLASSTGLVLCTSAGGGEILRSDRIITVSTHPNGAARTFSGRILAPKSCCLRVGHPSDLANNAGCHLSLGTAPFRATAMALSVRRVGTLTRFSARMP